jgi:hypothetical protein
MVQDSRIVHRSVLRAYATATGNLRPELPLLRTRAGPSARQRQPSYSSDALNAGYVIREWLRRKGLASFCGVLTPVVL